MIRALIISYQCLYVINKVINKLSTVLIGVELGYNYTYFNERGNMKNAIITIGESIHASIPKTAKVMKQLNDKGPNAYTNQS